MRLGCDVKVVATITDAIHLGNDNDEEDDDDSTVFIVIVMGMEILNDKNIL